MTVSEFWNQWEEEPKKRNWMLRELTPEFFEEIGLTEECWGFGEHYPAWELVNDVEDKKSAVAELKRLYGGRKKTFALHMLKGAVKEQAVEMLHIALQLAKTDRQLMRSFIWCAYENIDMEMKIVEYTKDDIEFTRNLIWELNREPIILREFCEAAYELQADGCQMIREIINNEHAVALVIAMAKETPEFMTKLLNAADMAGMMNRLVSAMMQEGNVMSPALKHAENLDSLLYAILQNAGEIRSSLWNVRRNPKVVLRIAQTLMQSNYQLSSEEKKLSKAILALDETAANYGRKIEEILSSLPYQE